MDFAAFSRAVFNECSGWGGWGGQGSTWSAGVSDLLLCEQSGGGMSWPPVKRQRSAGRSARTSSSEEDAEEDARSTDEEDRLLTKRCTERQWKTLVKE